MANLSKPRWNEAMDEHEQMLAALSARDSERLKQLLALHLDNKAQVIQEWLAASEGAPKNATA
jgi:DNA-binding GntR family transcriptional regulator